MNQTKQISLAEILDSVRAYPLSKDDMLRLNAVYSVDIDFLSEGERAVIYYEQKEYWFTRDIKDGLYNFKMEVNKQ